VSGFGLAADGYGSGWASADHDPFGIRGARRSIRSGLAALRAAVLDMRAFDLGDLRGTHVASVSTSPSRSTHGSRTRRPHTNEAPSRHQPSTVKQLGGGRVAAPGRQAGPGAAPDDLDAAVSMPVPAPVVARDLVDVDTGGGPRLDPGRTDPTDAAREAWKLVERAQAGDTEAFGLIYDKYVDTVFRFIYFRVGNRQLAEDLTSESFLRALKRIGTVTWQGRDLGAWLVTIARNLVADHFKSGRYRLEVTTGDVLDADREDRGPEGSPESAVVDHITNVTLLTAVKQLNPEQQECIVLRFLHGFSVAETAQAMSKNEGAIKALQYRAVRALNRLLPEGFHQ
jgi:RNA polymerase sigma-70 factor (ECF subfamily)